MNSYKLKDISYGYKSWISNVPGQPYKGKCKLCMKESDVKHVIGKIQS